MALDVTQLTVKVQSDGIADTTAQLNSFVTSAKNAENANNSLANSSTVRATALEKFNAAVANGLKAEQQMLNAGTQSLVLQQNLITSTNNRLASEENLVGALARRIASEEKMNQAASKTSIAAQQVLEAQAKTALAYEKVNLAAAQTALAQTRAANETALAQAKIANDSALVAAKVLEANNRIQNSAVVTAQKVAESAARIATENQKAANAAQAGADAHVIANNRIASSQSTAVAAANNAAASTTRLSSAQTTTTTSSHAAAQGIATFSEAVNNGRSRMELMVITHELFMGQHKRMIGSLMVLAETMNLTAAATNLLKNPFVLLGIALAVAEMAIFKYDASLLHMRNTLELTSNFAGQTAGSWEALNNEIVKGAHVSIGTAKTITDALISSGRVGPEILKTLSLAAAEYSLKTGKSAEDSAKAMMKIVDDPLRGIEELNRSMNFLTATQYSYIRSLEEAGEKEKAREVAAEIMLAAIEKAKVRLGTFAKAWHDVGEAASKAWNYIEHAGSIPSIEKTIEEAEQRVSRAKKALDDAQRTKDLAIKGKIYADTPNIDALKTELSLAENSLKDYQKVNVAQKERGAEQQRQTDAQREELELRKKNTDLAKSMRTSEQDLLDKRKGLETEIANIREKAKRGPIDIVDQQQITRDLDTIDKLDSKIDKIRNPKTPTDKSLTDFDTMMKALSDSVAKTQEEINTLANEIVDGIPQASHSALAKINADIDAQRQRAGHTGKPALSEDRANQLRQEAVLLDQEKDQLKQLTAFAKEFKETTNLDDQIRNFEDLTTSTNHYNNAVQAASKGKMMFLTISQEEAVYANALKHDYQEQTIAIEKQVLSVESQLEAAKLKSAAMQSEIDNGEKSAAALQKATVAQDELTLANLRWQKHQGITNEETSRQIKDIERLILDRKQLAGYESNQDEQRRTIETNKLIESWKQKLSVIDNETDITKKSNAAKAEAMLIEDNLRLAAATTIANTEGSTQAQKNQVDIIQQRIDKDKELLAIGKQLDDQQALKDFQIEFDKTSKKIENTLSEAFANATSKGKSGLKAMIADFEKQTIKLIVQPVFSQIAGGLTSFFMGGQQGGNGQQAGGISNVVGSLSNLFSKGIGGLGDLAGSFATSGIGQSLGLSQAATSFDMMDSMAAGGLQLTQAGTMLQGFASTIGAAMPYIGAALAVANLFLSPGGGPKSGGSATTGVTSAGAVTGSLGRDPFWAIGPNQADTTLQPVVNAIGAGFQQSLAALGGKSGGVNFQVGYDTDPQGTAQNRVTGVVKSATGQTLLSQQREVGRDNSTLQSEITLETQRMLVAALKASDLPDVISKILSDGVADASTATQEAITKTLADATFWKSTFIDGAGQAAKSFGEVISLDMFKSLQLAGESMTQTFQRIAPIFDSTNLIALAMGKNINEVFGAVGIASMSARQQLVDFAGGAQQLTTNINDYYKNFYTESERMAKSVAQATNDFSALGIKLPESREAFRALMDQQDLTTESGRKFFASLLNLEPEFVSITKSAEDLTKAANDAADAQGSLYEKFGDNSMLLAKATNDINDAFSKYGVAVPKTRQELAALIQSIDHMTPSGQGAITILQGLSGAFELVFGTAKDAADAATKAAKEAQDAADKAQKDYEAAVKDATDKQSGLYKTFASASDLASKATQSITDTFAGLHMKVPESREALTALISSLSTLTPEGQNAITAISLISDALQTKFIKSLTDAQTAIGLSGDAIKNAFVKAINVDDATIAGETLVDGVIGGIYSAMQNNLGQQVQDIIMTGVVNPMLQTLIKGGTLSQAVSAASFATSLEAAKTAISNMSKLINSEEFKNFIDSLSGMLGDLGTAGSGVAKYTPLVADKKKDTTASTKDSTTVDPMIAFMQGITRALEDLQAPTNYAKALITINRQYDDNVAKLVEMGHAGDSAAMAILNTTKALQLQQAEDDKNNMLQGYTIKLMQAQGFTYDALILSRQQEIANIKKTDGAVAALSQTLTYMAEDAANTRKLQIELLNAQGNASKALAMTREDELKALSPVDKAIKEQIYAWQDLQAAMAASKNGLDAIKGLVSAYGNTEGVNLINKHQAEQDVNTSYRGVEALLGLKPGDLDNYLQATGLSLEEAAIKWADALSTPQKEAVTTAIKAKTDLVNVNKQIADSYAALIQSGTDAIKKLLASQGQSKLLGSINTVNAASNYIEAKDKAGGLFGLSTGGLDKWLATTGLTIEEAAVKFGTVMTDAQKAVVTSAINAKEQFIQAYKAEYDAKIKMITDLQSSLENVQKLSQSISGNIADVMIDSGSVKKIDYINGQISDARTKLDGLIASGANVTEQSQAVTDLQTLIMSGYAEQKTAITDLMNFAASLSAYAKQLLLGDLSPLTLTQKLKEAEIQYRDVITGAKAGDKTAQGKVTSSADTMLKLQLDASVSNVEYSRKLYAVQNDLAMLGADNLTDAERQTKYLGDIGNSANNTVNQLQALKLITNNMSEQLLAQLKDAQSGLPAIVTALSQLGVNFTESLSGLSSAVLSIVTKSLPTGTAGTLTNPTTGATSGNAVTASTIVAAIGNNTSLTNANSYLQQAASAGVGINALAQAWSSKHPDNPITASDLEAYAKSVGIKGFASGGDTEGLSMVGENGPELMYTPPSHVYSNADSMKMAMSDKEELAQIKQAIIDLKNANTAENHAVIKNTHEQQKISKRWDQDGIPVSPDGLDFGVLTT